MRSGRDVGQSDLAGTKRLQHLGNKLRPLPIRSTICGPQAVSKHCPSSTPGRSAVIERSTMLSSD
jgi:hypothetical protein